MKRLTNGEKNYNDGTYLKKITLVNVSPYTKMFVQERQHKPKENMKNARLNCRLHIEIAKGLQFCICKRLILKL